MNEGKKIDKKTIIYNILIILFVSILILTSYNAGKNSSEIIIIEENKEKWNLESIKLLDLEIESKSDLIEILLPERINDTVTIEYIPTDNWPFSSIIWVNHSNAYHYGYHHYQVQLNINETHEILFATSPYKEFENSKIGIITDYVEHVTIHNSSLLSDYTCGTNIIFKEMGWINFIRPIPELLNLDNNTLYSFYYDTLSHYPDHDKYIFLVKKYETNGIVWFDEKMSFEQSDFAFKYGTIPGEVLSVINEEQFPEMFKDEKVK